MKILNLALVLLLAPIISIGQLPQHDFQTVVDELLRKEYKRDFETVCPITSDWVSAKIFREYGAIFVAKGGTMLPPRCIYESEAELERLHSQIDSQTEMIDSIRVTLQRPAMAALLNARQQAAKRRLRISPRGGATASARNYLTTVTLWKSRVDPGLRYWRGRGRISAADANAAANAPTREQIEKILAWEEDGIFFSKDLSKSILYSVAVPGASQHNFLLALDVEQFGNAQVRAIMAENGWFQTVKSDLPHFTYLGLKESELPANGLKSVTVGGQKFWIPNLSE